jgi:hypothetical protein
LASLREQRLAGAGRPDQQDVGFGELDVVAPARLFEFRAACSGCRPTASFSWSASADDLLVEELRFREARAGVRAAAVEPVVVHDDVVADLDTPSQMKTVGPAINFRTF